MNRYPLPSEIGELELIAFLLMLIVAFVSWIFAKIFRKRDSRKFDYLFTFILAMDMMSIFSLMAWIFLKEGNFFLVGLFMFMAALIFFVAIMLINEKKQKDFQDKIDEKQKMLEKKTSQKYIKVLDIKKGVRFYFACDGTGTKDDPYIIQSPEQLPNSFNLNGFNEEDFLTVAMSNSIEKILEINKFLTINNLKREKIELSYINVKLENCSCDRLKLFRCTKSTLKNIFIQKKMKLEQFNESLIESCNIQTLKLKSYSNNLFRSCSIRKISSSYSKKNTFEKCDIPEKEREKLREEFDDWAEY